MPNRDHIFRPILTDDERTLVEAVLYGQPDSSLRPLAMTPVVIEPSQFARVRSELAALPLPVARALSRISDSLDAATRAFEDFSTTLAIEQEGLEHPATSDFEKGAEKPGKAAAIKEASLTELAERRAAICIRLASALMPGATTAAVEDKALQLMDLDETQLHATIATLKLVSGEMPDFIKEKIEDKEEDEKKNDDDEGADKKASVDVVARLDRLEHSSSEPSSLLFETEVRAKRDAIFREILGLSSPRDVWGDPVPIPEPESTTALVAPPDSARSEPVHVNITGGVISLTGGINPVRVPMISGGAGGGGGGGGSHFISGDVLGSSLSSGSSAGVSLDLDALADNIARHLFEKMTRAGAQA